MILAIDVQYSESTAFVAGIMFEDWCSEVSAGEFVSVLDDVAEYEPGSFYKRELPCILKLLNEHKLQPKTIVVDGYVFLDAEQRPGLGKYLYDALNGEVEVIGVAKRSFSGIGENHEVLRGKSVKPLYVTTSGELEVAKANIATMFGVHRIPVLLKRADQLCREEASNSINMPSNLVKNWFGDQFTDLHPLLQQLHINGGSLSGDVEISYGKGLAGIIGGRLAKKMSLPNGGSHQLIVSISHDSEGLHWGRCFNNQNVVTSLFKPVGHIDQGHWIETTGPLTMKLTVDVQNGGWYWRCLKVSFLGAPIPRWLIPKTNAYKIIEDGQYRFHVEFSLPLIGSLVSYRGLLRAE